MSIEEMDWNQRYSDRDTPWDKGGPAPAIASLAREGVFQEGARVFVPGCGTGHDVAAFASLSFEVVGLDVSELAIEQARGNYPDLGSSFVLGDLFDLDEGMMASFDVVWEHTCYCAIHPDRRGDYVSAVHRLLKPGGLLVGLFFTDTQMPEGEGPPYETSRDEVVEMFAPFFTLVSEKIPPACYPDRVGREWLMIWKSLDTMES